MAKDRKIYEKKMKKAIFALLLILGTLNFCGCDSNDYNNDQNEFASDYDENYNEIYAVLDKQNEYSEYVKDYISFGEQKLIEYDAFFNIEVLVENRGDKNIKEFGIWYNEYDKDDIMVDASSGNHINQFHANSKAWMTIGSIMDKTVVKIEIYEITIQFDDDADNTCIELEKPIIIYKE